MKLIDHLDDQKTVRLGIVKLGTSVGKMKYALIDETDIPIIHDYKFDARLQIDRNGDGIRVIAMGHAKGKSTPQPSPLQNILWEHRNGPIETGFQVCHLNGITMDNRLDNLTLIPNWVSRLEQDTILELRCTESHVWTERRQGLNHQNNNHPAAAPVAEGAPPPARSRSLYEPRGAGAAAAAAGAGDGHGHGHPESDDEFNPPLEDNKREKRIGENSLYWKAITQLLANETDEQRNASSAPCSRAYYTTEGELISRDCPSFYYFECHYPPCAAIETEPREFAMCGRCQQARYCGRECQRDDWTIHREHCESVAQRRQTHSYSSRSLKSSSRRDSARNAEADR